MGSWGEGRNIKLLSAHLAQCCHNCVTAPSQAVFFRCRVGVKWPARQDSNLWLPPSEGGTLSS